MEEILKTLVEIPSVSRDAKQNNRAIEYIDRFLSERGMFVKRFEKNGFESVVATTRNTKKPKILLTAHVDVVGADNDQFKLKKENGKYYGRGVADMKFAIAAYLQIVDELQESLQLYDFGIAVTSDEEVGGECGSGEIINQGYRSEVVILPDAGNSPDGWKIERSAKGGIFMEVLASGWSSHGSQPWAGENAIDKLIKILDEIKKLFKENGPETNTLTVAKISGGEADNKVPANAKAFLDIRTVSNDDSKRIIKTITEIAEKNKGSVYFPYAIHPAVKTDLDNPRIKEFIATARDVVTNYKISIEDSYGATDAHFFADAGIPYVVFSPTLDGYHSIDEWVSKDGLIQTRDVIKLYIERYAGLLSPEKIESSKSTIKQSARS